MKVDRTVYTAGVWDILHQGHLNMLHRSRMMAGQFGRLVVGVVSDDGAAAYKRRPVQDQWTRARVISAMRFVDAVLIQDGTDPSPILRVLHPDIMTHGDDWHRLREGHETLEEMGIEWRLVPYTPGFSTTSTILRMETNERVDAIRAGA